MRLGQLVLLWMMYCGGSSSSLAASEVACGHESIDEAKKMSSKFLMGLRDHAMHASATAVERESFLRTENVRKWETWCSEFIDQQRDQLSRACIDELEGILRKTIQDISHNYDFRILYIKLQLLKRRVQSILSGGSLAVSIDSSFIPSIHDLKQEADRIYGYDAKREFEAIGGVSEDTMTELTRRLERRYSNFFSIF